MISMDQTLNLVATGVSVLALIIAIVKTSTDNERKLEKKLTRIETLLVIVCDKLKIPIDQLNND